MGRWGRGDLANTVSKTHVSCSEMAGGLLSDCLALLIRCFECLRETYLAPQSMVSVTGTL